MIQRRRHGRPQASRSNHPRHPKSYKVLCSDCGKEIFLPVSPPVDKKLLCMACFKK